MSVSNPGGGIAGKGGSFWTAALGSSMASTKVEAEIAEWNLADETEAVEATNFNSRDSGDATQAVMDRSAGLDSFTITCKGKISSYSATSITAMTPGSFLQVYLGAVGGGNMSGVVSTDVAAGRLGYGPYAVRVSKCRFGNQVAGVQEFDATLVSVASRATTA